jgi:hypothetical protein
VSAREARFGTDLRVDPAAGGLDLRSDGGGALTLARGNDSVIQGLRLRLMVRHRELAPLGWPDFGSRLHELIGEPDNTRTRARLAAYARAAVEGDARVGKVTDVRVVSVPGERATVEVRMEILLVGASLPLSLGHTVRLEAS